MDCVYLFSLLSFITSHHISSLPSSLSPLPPPTPFSVCSTIFPLTVTAQMINPQDNTLIVQAAIKNLATNGVFYFGIPVAMEVRHLYLFCGVGDLRGVDEGLKG